MSNASELALNRRNTLAFIAENPTTVALTPQRRVRTATGGYEVAIDIPRSSQSLRIIDLTSTQAKAPDRPPQRTIDGEERSIEYMFLGPYDAVWEQYDVWIDGGNHRWEIVGLFPDNGYERRALVVRYGI